MWTNNAPQAIFFVAFPHFLRLFYGIYVTEFACLVCRSSHCYASGMTELLESALRKVAMLPQDEQDAIASQIIETLQDEAAWREKLTHDPEKLRRLAEEARQGHRCGETRPLDERCIQSRTTRA
jgi:hypothetical protein